MNVAEKLSTIQVRDLSGEPYRLRDAWKERTAVLVFIRHYG